MKIAVFGSSGFVGSHLTSYLLGHGNEVQCINIRDEKWQQSIAEDTEIYIHLIGKAHELGRKSGEDAYRHANVELTKATFEYFGKSNAKKYIFLSSIAAVEEKQIDGIMDENTIPHPFSPYGKSKLEAEQWLTQQHLSPEKQLIILRPSMIHGAGDKGNLRLFFSLISKGIPYPLGAFDNQRSFLSVDNLCWTLLQICFKKDFPSGIYNIVDDAPIGSEALVQLFGKALNKKAKIWKISPAVIKAMGKIGDRISAFPLNSLRIAKLTGNYVVSNQKIKNALGIINMPVDAIDGINKTIKSFIQN